MDIVEFETTNKDLIQISKIKNKIIKIREDKDVLKNINFKGMFLLETFRISPEMVKLIANKKRALFLIDVSKLTGSFGPKRGILLAQLREFFTYCVKYDAKYSFVSLAKNENEIREEKEIVGIGALVGLNEGQVKFSLKEIRNFL